MFFYPEVLQRHRGCLGTVWLAATCSERLRRREVLGVDVVRASSCVLCFLIGRPGWEDPPPPPSSPPRRCSLYLASLLQLGLARLLLRQGGLLLGELLQLLEKLNRAQPPPPNIDLDAPTRPQLLPDARALMELLEQAPDPTFGEMAPPPPSPTSIQLLLLEELPPPPRASPESITLREPPPLPPPPPPEEELPEVTLRELELLEEAELELGVTVEEPTVELPPPPPEEPTEELLPPPAPAPPRPHLPHSDPRPQIPPRLLQALLLLPHGACADLVLLDPPHKWLRSFRELLETPACGWLSPELWGLWSRCSRPPQAPELPTEVEMLREALEPSLAALPSSELSVEPSLEESRPLPPPEERRPVLPPPALPELPEPPELPLPPRPPPNHHLRRRALLLSRVPGGSPLESLLPPGASRRDVGGILLLCLELCGRGLIRLQQPLPFGPILMGEGPRATATPPEDTPSP